MSVCIKGFKMPTCCYFCPMLEINQYSEAYCEAVGESTIIKCTYGEKPDFCPLVEVGDKELKATNVQPVKRGHWIKETFDYSRCSICGEIRKPSNFCPECGARMDGDME